MCIRDRYNSLDSVPVEKKSKRGVRMVEMKEYVPTLELETKEMCIRDSLRGGHNAGMVSRAEKFHRYRSFLPEGPSLGLILRQRPEAVFCLFPPGFSARV